MKDTILSARQCDQYVIHLPLSLVLRPFVVRLFGFNAPCQFTTSQLALIFGSALWLAAFCYAIPLFLMGLSFFIYAHFFRDATRA
jgi:hypothetical protein